MILRFTFPFQFSLAKKHSYIWMETISCFKINPPFSILLPTTFDHSNASPLLKDTVWHIDKMLRVRQSEMNYFFTKVKSCDWNENILNLGSHDDCEINLNLAVKKHLICYTDL